MTETTKYIILGLMLWTNIMLTFVIIHSEIRERRERKARKARIKKDF